MEHAFSDNRNQHSDRCLVWGGYGWGNTGDDLTLAIALQDLRKGYGPHVTLLTPRSDHTGAAHPGVPLVGAPWDLPRGKFEQWLWHMADRAASHGRKDASAARWYRLALRFHRARPADGNWHEAFASASVLHLVGGGYLTDVFNLRYMLRPLHVARAMKLPIRTSPLGIGPFSDPGAGRGVARALQGAEVVVRDEVSLRFCQLHGLNVEERPDDGFRLREVVGPGGCADRDQGARRSIGVCIFSQFSDRWSPMVENWWVNCLRSLVLAFPRWSIEGFCFHTDRDMDFRMTRDLFSRAGLDANAVRPPDPDYRAAVASLRNFSAIVSTRFHAVVAASVFEIPCVAVAVNDYYEIKMRSAARHSRSPLSLLNPTQASPDAVIQHLQQALGGNAPVQHPSA